MATSRDGFGHYGACPPVLVHLPGRGLVEGTTLSPIDERDEVLINENRLRRLEADAALGIPCDLLPEPFCDEFLPDDIIFFRRSPNKATSQEEINPQEFQAHLAIRLATWMNFLTSLVLIVFLSTFSLIYRYLEITPLGFYALFAFCLIFRLLALLFTFGLLLHHRTKGLRGKMRYNELCTMSPLLHYFIPAPDRAKVSSAVLDTFSFIDSVLFDATQSALTETVPLIGNQARYAPLSAVDRQQSLNNGWLILHFARYPDPLRSHWCPMRRLLTKIYHLQQDWRRYKAAAVVFQTMEEQGSISSGIAVLEYSIKRIKWESRQPRLARMGYHFIPKYVGDLEVGDSPEQMV